MAIKDYEHEGRLPRGVGDRHGRVMRDLETNAPMDTPVMDRGGHSRSPTTRAGLLTHVSTARSGFNKRDDKDNRPGTPVPFHEPDPLRFEKAEALRQSILAQEKRRGGTGAYNHKVIRQPTHAKRTYGVAALSKLPDVTPDKVWPHYTCMEASAAVRGERDGVVLFFESAVQAQMAMTGVPNSGKNIAAAAAGISRGAYGWTWTRLKRSTTGPKGEEIRARRLTK